ncbi:MAG: hypothetical protein N2319_02125 [Candidatus Kapabacteria bacterium]|nr:hypothetical protein [Candidatus Kapabacteria bacterium]
MNIKPMIVKMLNSHKIKILILIFLSFFISFTSESEAQKKKKNDLDSNSRILVLLGNVELGPEVHDLEASKIEAGLHLACELSKKFRLIPITVRDSVINLMLEQKKDPTAENLAKELQADKVYFAVINRLHNMLRIDLTAFDTKASKKKYKGKGYANLRYREEKTNKIIYDPALLKAFQRAMADAENDSLLFGFLEDNLKVYPAASLIIGGIDFQEDKTLPSWKLYEKKVVTSFDATEIIFNEIKDHPKFAVYDNPSRDSLYSLFHMHIVENYRPPTSFEILALNAMEVDYYITGLLKRVNEGALLEIVLCKVNKKNLEVVKSEKEMIYEDSIEEFRAAVKKSIRRIFYPE